MANRERGRNDSDSSQSDDQNPSNERRTRRSTISRNSDNAADRTRANPSTNPNGGSNNADRERDENGRFTGSSKSAAQSALGRMMAGFKGITGNGNIGGVDPVLDSLKEAKDLLSPLGRAAKLGGRAAKFSFSKLKAMKRREPLPIDQDRHNRENEKLLDKIWKAIKKAGSNAGGGLGGLLGAGGGRNRNRRRNRRRGRGRGLLNRARDLGTRGLRAVGGVKGLGVVGALAGAATLGMDWKGLNKEEKTERVGQAGGGAAGALIGGTVGSVVPVVGTAIGAVVGGYLGAKGGAIIAQTVSPHVSSWTSSLKSYNLADKMDKFWKAGMTPVFSTFEELGRSTKSWLGNMFKKGKSLFGFTDDDNDDNGGDLSAGVTVKANKAADIITKNALTKSSGYCAKFVREGLQQAGYDLKTAGDAKNYNNGALTDAGFSKIEGDSAPQKGDVMVMPAQGRHGAGHMQIYNGQQWVSDFKQNSKNPWGDIATEDLKYTMYRDQKGAMVAGTARGGEKSAIAASGASEAVNFFTSRGYTKEQAIGLAANIQQESQFNHKAYNVDKTGKTKGARGLAQWRGPRQDDFKRRYGVSIENSTKQQQYDFIDYELRHGKEQAAGKALMKAKTVKEATYAVLDKYERAGNTATELPKRMANANAIEKNHSVTMSKASKAKATSSVTGFSMKELKVANNIAPTSNASNSGYGAASFAPTPMLKIPAMPKITQRLDSGGLDKPLLTQANNDSINQNVSDRDLAHAITGGLGQSRQWA